MSRGFSRCSASQPSPRRSMAPGPMFSTSTSAVFTMSRNMVRPRSDFRLSVTPFLPELSNRKNHASSPRLSESAVRPGSPVGGSILMTSAPSHASIWVQDGPASYWVRSRTRIPAKAWAMSGPPPLRGVGGEAHRLRPRLVVGDDVDHRRLARGEGPLERGTDVVRLLHELAVRAQLLRDAVVARVAEIAPGLGQGPGPRRVRGPAAVVADHHHHRDLVAHRRVDLHRVDAVGAVAVQHEHLRVGLGHLGPHAE